MSVFDELANLVQTVGETAGPAVVAIGTRGRGTGFVVAPGKVLTNAHNLRDRTTQVTFSDGRSVQGSVTGSDIDGDLVVLDVDTVGIAPLAWADEPPSAGDIIVAITAGRHRRRVVWGQVTATETGFTGPRGRPITGALEHAAPSAPGSSGAPVLDRDGRVVGINTHRLEDGLYLARTVDATLRSVVDGMTADERSRPPYWAWPSPRSTWRPGCATRWDWPSATACWFETSPPTARQHVPVSGRATCSFARDRTELRRHEDLFAVLGTLGSGDQLALGLVRGADELEVTVTF